MIYLSSYNLAFIKIPKNASTAVSKILLESDLTTDSDVITYTTYKNNFLTRNCSTDPSLAHITMSEAVNLGFVPEYCNSFCVIRNPVERLLSLYLYRCRQGLHKLSVSTFSNLVYEGGGTINDHRWQNLLQSDFIAPSTTLLLYDSLFEELQVLYIKYFNKTLGSLECVNSSSNAATKDLIDYFYTASTKQLVNSYYERDIILYDKLRNTSITSRLSSAE
jgi:hypothetical protein